MAALEDSNILDFSLPRDEIARTEVYQSLVHGFVESGENRELRLMVIGEAGQGKSTLINALVGQEVAKEGGNFIAGTVEVQRYRKEQNGVVIWIWDTPGFGIGTHEEEQEMVEQLKRDGCDTVDLALFCVRMDTQRFPTRVHSDTITKLNEVFGRGFWKHCLFVLTFANNIQQFCPVGESMKDFFSQRCLDLEDQIKVAMQTYARLDKESLNTVRAVPVGSHRKGLFRDNQWALPDREDWFVMFWMECTEHMHQSALSALLRANYHRLEAADDSQQSSSGPPPQFDPQDRLLKATPDELAQIRIQLKDDEADRISLSNNVPPLGSTAGPLPTHRRELDDGQLDLTEDCIHERKVPLRITLLKQLQQNGSGFLKFVETFAKARAETSRSPLPFGYFEGFIDGLIAYFGLRLETLPGFRRNNYDN